MTYHCEDNKYKLLGKSAVVLSLKEFVPVLYLVSHLDVYREAEPLNKLHEILATSLPRHANLCVSHAPWLTQFTSRSFATRVSQLKIWHF